MDNHDGELDLSSPFFLSNTEMDEFFSSTSTCTHTHTCNPPGPNATGHTHTCYHTHTRVLATDEEEEEDYQDDKPKRSRKPLGNREAVRKYREKKKAHTAYLEEEVKKLRVMNQQLVRKLQGQTALQAEVVRLRALLADLRGRIDAELGMFPFQKQCDGTNFQCDTALPCLNGNGGLVGWERNCQPPIVHCHVDQNGNGIQNAETEAAISMGVLGSLVSSGSQVESHPKC